MKLDLARIFHPDVWTQNGMVHEKDSDGKVITYEPAYPQDLRELKTQVVKLRKARRRDDEFSDLHAEEAEEAIMDLIKHPTPAVQVDPRFPVAPEDIEFLEDPSHGGALYWLDGTRGEFPKTGKDDEEGGEYDLRHT